MQALAWRKTSQEAATIPPSEGVKEMVRVGSVKVVKVLTKQALDLEGIRMNNCINGHDYSGKEIYSIRTLKDESVCCIHMKGHELEELRGPNNWMVDEKYHEVCLKIINDVLKMDSSSMQGENSAQYIEAFVDWEEKEKRFKLFPSGTVTDAAMDRARRDYHYRDLRGED